MGREVNNLTSTNLHMILKIVLSLNTGIKNHIHER